MKRRKIILSGAFAAVLALATAAAFSFSSTAKSLSATSKATAGSSPAPARLDTTPAQGETVQAHQVQSIDGGSWSLTTVKNAAGQLCFGEKVPTGSTRDGGQAWSCHDPATMFANGPLNYSTGAVLASTKHYNVWVDGVAAPAVSKLVLELSDCSAIQLPIDGNGAFHHVFGVGEIAQGVGPHQLIAYGADGAVLARYPTTLAAVSLPAAAPGCS